jgi:hypothetical protein
VQRFKLGVAVVLGIVGSVWLGQGMGLLPGSFMSGDRFWAIAGLVAVGLGAYLAWDAVRRR